MGNPGLRTPAAQRQSAAAGQGAGGGGCLGLRHPVYRRERSPRIRREPGAGAGTPAHHGRSARADGRLLTSPPARRSKQRPRRIGAFFMAAHHQRPTGSRLA
ncbi:hypothetical protein G6F46_015534 [Rhizopus delemar]|nr:hypothetical protein G6F46_015534 [Rhizopus delemar]